MKWEIWAVLVVSLLVAYTFYHNVTLLGALAYIFIGFPLGVLASYFFIARKAK